MKRQGAGLSHSAAGTAGFTVAELVAASAILFVILVGVLGAVEYAGAATRMAAMRQTGINVATAQIEKNRNIPWDEIGVTYSNGLTGNPPGIIPANTTVTTSLGTYTIDTEVWWARDEVTEGEFRAAYKKMRVTVSWNTPVAGRLAVETAVFGTSDTGVLGDVQIKAVEAEDPTKVVKDVTFQIDPVPPTGGSTTRAKTDADGIAFFSGIQPVQVSVTATSADWLVDLTGIPTTPTIHSGYQNLGTATCQKACTAVVHVRSELVPNLRYALVTLTDKDRGLTYQAESDADGNARFEGLWMSHGAGYEAVATFEGKVSQVESFSLTSSGQEYTHPDPLVVTEPPSITVSRVVAGTETTITGRPWHLQLKNPSGVTVLDITTSENSVTQQILVGGDYTAIVTGVSGFLDNTGFTFPADAVGTNQKCKVPMTPYFLVRVRGGGVGLRYAAVTVTKVGGGPAVKTITGANPPGITDANGEIGFSIVSDGDYDVAAVVNGVTYNGPQTHIVAASPPTSPYVIDVPLRHLVVKVKRKASASWTRNVGLYDAANRLVATTYATYSDPDVDFYVPAGMYTVVICGTYTSYLPPTTPAYEWRTYGPHPLDSPGVPTDGSTLTVPSSGTWSEP